MDPTVSKHPIGGYHHMGDNADGRFSQMRRRQWQMHASHGIDNLYVAGSSVFPTSGWANPVLTTMALTFRLADHLKQVV